MYIYNIYIHMCICIYNVYIYTHIDNAAIFMLHFIRIVVLYL